MEDVREIIICNRADNNALRAEDLGGYPPHGADPGGVPPLGGTSNSGEAPKETTGWGTVIPTDRGGAKGSGD